MTEPKFVAKNFDRPTIYYTIIYWSKEQKYGTGLKQCYRNYNNALRKAEQLYETKLYDVVTIRKETVYFRNYNNEYSTSGLIKTIGEHSNSVKEFYRI